MSKENKKHRAFRIEDTPYLKAMKRASKEKSRLADIVRGWIYGYANGHTIIVKEEIKNAKK